MNEFESIVIECFNFPDFQDGSGTLVMLVKLFEIYAQILQLNVNYDIIYHKAIKLMGHFEQNMLTPTMVINEIFHVQN